ncbi:ABC transporter substrate-binding protein [Luteitalea sp. TBR-22]|uniref:cation:dicarboxylate symporter family transporter n=1 Tax=Luteitalea sp. TBR-22 TaxID=2802971 RepID=UPI001AF4E720|nr:cation:dicarboxylase symporter family transporter [Luteitalea sp. TBR-22]BCS35138.1 ABC transporter substrate-binding protein [Luteitalea sp. TBR-22]
MSFSTRILLWLAAGAATGVLLGDLVAPLGVIATGFVKLLQMTVLPYVVISIVASLGHLSAVEARRLGVRAGLVLLALWSTGLAFALLMPAVFPVVRQGAFFSTSMLERPPDFDFVDLYIPSNPFNSLANNIVPAVVLFSIVLGVALIAVPRKHVLLDVLSVASDMVGRATKLVVRLTPYGMFAVAAVAAGTLQIEQLARIQVYLVAYVAIAMLLAAWVLPGLVSALTPIGYLELLRPTRAALLTAFVAGDLFIVLPTLTDACKELLSRHVPEADRDHATGLPDVIVPASFNFPHTGKLLSLSFVLFAGWFANAAIPFTSYPALALTGLLTFFGSLNAAVPFLLDVFRIPADTFQLFLATGVINQRFGSLLAAVHTVVVGLLGSAALAGLIRFDAKRLTRYLVITATLTVVVLGSLRLLFETALRPHFDGGAVVAALAPVLPRAEVADADARGSRAAGAPVLDAVRTTGVVRVCYVEGRPPYAFDNAHGSLVGLDVEMAHQLAIDLQARLHLVPRDAEALSEGLASGECDIAMGGVVATPLRATQLAFSTPYMEESLAFVVPDHLRAAYGSWDAVRARGAVRLALPDLPYFRRQVQQRLPEAVMVPLTATAGVFAPGGWTFEAMVLSAERGAFLTLLYPGYSVVVPTPGLIRVPVAYGLPQGDAAWKSFVDAWLELHSRDGSLTQLIDHWIFGRSFAPHQPRWSIVRNVLHWVD